MWIKYCGIIRSADLSYAVELGVDAIGVIAVPGTPRCISVKEAESLAILPRISSRLTLVLRNPMHEYAAKMISVVKPDLLQFHGSETPEFAEEFGLPYIKAIRSYDSAAISALTKHLAAFAWLADTITNEMHSDTLRRLRDLHPSRHLIVAGGLSCQTVVGVVQQVQPWGVDVSRGIEKAPREKDHLLMREFVHAARG